MPYKMGVVFTLLIILFVFLLLVLCIKAVKDRLYFEKRGIFYLGNRSYSLFYESLIGITIPESCRKWYQRLVQNGHKVGGAKEFGNYVYIASDPEFVKQISIKDFEYFVNRREFEMPEEEKIFSKMLFALRGQKWKDVRSAVSPAFTTSKIKRIFPLFRKSGKEMLSYIDKQISGPEAEINFTATFSKHTIEVIATAVCGLQSKAFDTTGISAFEEMAHRLELQFGGLQLVKLFVVLIFPRIANLLRLSFFDKEAQNFYGWAINKTIKMRESNEEMQRNDFIQLMIETKKHLLEEEKKEGNQLSIKKSEYFEDDHITANCILFILAGYNTSRGALIFSLYELALNPDMQDRLRKEVEEFAKMDQDKGEELWTYESLNQMKYLDMIMSETLRMYPPTVTVDRGCTTDYPVPGSDLIIKKGEGVTIPIFAFHRDPRYFPEPDKFDPERFSDKNKILPDAYMPFGNGPRSCIGMRFAVTEAKEALSSIIYNYIVKPSKETPIPMEFKNYNSLKPKIPLKFNLTKIPRCTKL